MSRALLIGHSGSINWRKLIYVFFNKVFVVFTTRVIEYLNFLCRQKFFDDSLLKLQPQLVLKLLFSSKSSDYYKLYLEIY